MAIVDGSLADASGPPSTPALEARLDAEGITLAEGQRAEICLATDAWVAGAAGGLAKGLLLLIDYGHPAAALYDNRRRPRGTLARVRQPQDPRRPVPGDRPAGPDRPRRRHRGRGGGERGRPGARRDDDPGPVPRRARGRRPARRAAVRPGRRPGGLPRREGVARPDDRPGGDGRVRGHGVRPRPAGRCVAPWADRHRSRTPPDPTGLRRSPYRHALRRTRRLRSPMGPAVVRVVVHRRGTDRELARALGAIRPPPTSAAPSQGHSAGGRGREPRNAGRGGPRPDRRGALRPVLGGPPLLE